MKTVFRRTASAALIAAPVLLLAACGSTDEADAPAEADNVEMPAAEVMAQPGMDEDPAVEPETADMVDEPIVEPAEPVVDPTAEEAADAADDAAADLSAAMEEE